MMAAAREEKRRSFTDDWRCSICHELPISPFLTPCGHCMCFECATKLPRVQVALAAVRKCPTCALAIRDVLKQPLLARTLDDHASCLWPDVWALWEELRTLDVSQDANIFNLVARFVCEADDDTLDELRLLRLAARFGHVDNKYRSVFLEPLIAVETGGTWDGYGPWLSRAIGKCELDKRFLLVSIADAAEPAHAAAALHLIPLLARVTRKSDWIGHGDLSNFAHFAQTYIDCVDGGLASLVDTPGFATIVPAREIAALFAESPSSHLLGRLTTALEVQFDGVRENDATFASSVTSIGAVMGTVAAVMVARGRAASSSLDVAAVKFAFAVCELLPAEHASLMLRQHSFIIPGAVAAPPAPQQVFGFNSSLIGQVFPKRGRLR